MNPNGFEGSFPDGTVSAANHLSGFFHYSVEGPRLCSSPPASVSWVLGLTANTAIWLQPVFRLQLCGWATGPGFNTEDPRSAHLVSLQKPARCFIGSFPHTPSVSALVSLACASPRAAQPQTLARAPGKKRAMQGQSPRAALTACAEWLT